MTENGNGTVFVGTGMSTARWGGLFQEVINRRANSRLIAPTPMARPAGPHLHLASGCGLPASTYPLANTSVVLASSVWSSHWRVAAFEITVYQAYRTGLGQSRS